MAQHRHRRIIDGKVLSTIEKLVDNIDTESWNEFMPKGVTKEIFQEALAQAHKARHQILEVMLNAIDKPREDVGKYAPKVGQMNIDVSNGCHARNRHYIIFTLFFIYHK